MNLVDSNIHKTAFLFSIKMGKKKAKPADVYRPMMEQANTAATPVAPQVQKVDEYTNKLFDMYSGKTQFELSAMPNSSAMLTLYQNAKNTGDIKRIGRGLNYGEGANPTQLAAIREQDELERNQQAKGELEERVSDTFKNLPQQMLGLGEINQSNRDNAFSRTAQMYGMEINKPKKPAWWESLLGGLTGAAASWASSGFQTGTPKNNNARGSSFIHESMHSF